MRAALCASCCCVLFTACKQKACALPLYNILQPGPGPRHGLQCLSSCTAEDRALVSNTPVCLSSACSPRVALDVRAV
jgi:hypothetical protein